MKKVSERSERKKRRRKERKERNSGERRKRKSIAKFCASCTTCRQIKVCAFGASNERGRKKKEWNNKKRKVGRERERIRKKDE